MSQLFLAYMGSVMLRSIGIALIAGICSWRVRNVAQRHAMWAVVLAAVVLMPAIDYVLPPAWVPMRIQQMVSEHSETMPVVSLKTAIGFQGRDNVASMAAAREVAAVQAEPVNWWRIAVVLYGAVALALLVRLAVGYRKIWKLRRAGKMIPDSIWRRHIEHLQPRWRVPVVLESDAVQVPMTVAFFRPSILLPVSWQQWDEWKLRAVLLHEMAHIRRGDWGFAAIAALARCIHWFNPLSWFLERKLSELAEQASDDASISRTRNTTQYAEILLEFAATAQAGGRVTKGGIAMAQHRIQSRIERVLRDSEPGSGIMKIASWTLVLILAAPVIYSAAAVQVASRSVNAETPAPVAMEPISPQAASEPQSPKASAPVAAAPAVRKAFSPVPDLRELIELEKANSQVRAQYQMLQQKVAEAELAQKLATAQGRDRPEGAGTIVFLNDQLQKLKNQMEVLEAERRAAQSKLSQFASTSGTAQLPLVQSQVEDLLKQLGIQFTESRASAAGQVEPGRQGQKQGVAAGEYRMKPGDVISVFVFNHPELSIKVTVQPDGRVSTPLVQSIVAAELSPSELKDTIERRLEEFIDKPNVTVILESISVERR